MLLLLSLYSLLSILSKAPWWPDYSLYLILTTFTMPICVLASWSNVSHSPVQFMVTLLLTESILVLIFTVQDLLLFYVAFEAVLVPIFYMI